MRTAQELFDTVATHLLKQNSQARRMDVNGSGCAYRSDDGKKCAVGCLIPDELYSPKYEDLRVARLLKNGAFPSPLREEFSENLSLLEYLQAVHDRYPAVAWEEQLLSVAGRFGLQFNVPK